VKFLRSRRGLAVIAAVLLVLFLFRPGVSGLRKRITRSIGSALGRQVTLENVRAHLLPRPGFDLEGLVIYDDPAFSAEPMVRAQDVWAGIRLSSLLRGRLEIATLSATEPSINLVRNSDGRWNLGSLLERTAHIPIAPTGKPASERRPAFPYLEATHARINFKLGQEKKSYSLTDADLALWQDSENSWAARFTAQPVRTDFNLTDTGLLRMNATWQRAARLGETPVQATVRWDNGQLGQITKLFSGRDRGWRGGVNLAADISGTPEALLIRSQLAIADFHRYDIGEGENVRLVTGCSGRYSTADQVLKDLTCESPVGVGVVRLQGSVGPISATPGYDLKLAVDRVPLPSVLRLVRQTKKELPRDLVATGQLDAEFLAQCGGTGPPTVSGEGSVSDLRLALNGGKDEISFGDVPIVVAGGASKATVSAKLKNKVIDQEPPEAHVRLGPFPLGLGNPTPATAAGWLSLSGYHLSLHGETELKNVFRLANAFGVAGLRPTADGAARVDVSLEGPWQGFAAPAPTGTAQLHNVRAGMRGLNVPIEIAAAAVVLEADTVSLRKLSADIGTTHWSGEVTAPRHCAGPDCIFQFDLAADQLSTSDLTEWFTPHPAKRPWYRPLSAGAQEGPSPLLRLQAKGSVHVNHLGLRKVAATQVASRVELDRGRITLTGLQGQILDGMHRGAWFIDASSQTLRYQGKGTLQGVSLAQAAGLMGDAWVTGTADGKYDLASTGNTIADLVAHAEGDLQFSMQNGTLKNIELAGGAKPFPVHRFRGELKLKKGSWELRAGKLESRDGIYQVSGSASPDGGLDFVFVRGDEQKWNVTGPLAKPRVVPANRTEARTAVKP
jgi:hypothetical protein